MGPDINILMIDINILRIDIDILRLDINILRPSNFLEYPIPPRLSVCPLSVTKKRTHFSASIYQTRALVFLQKEFHYKMPAVSTKKENTNFKQHQQQRGGGERRRRQQQQGGGEQRRRRRQQQRGG